MKKVPTIPEDKQNVAQLDLPIDRRPTVAQAESRLSPLELLVLEMRGHLKERSHATTTSQLGNRVGVVHIEGEPTRITTWEDLEREILAATALNMFDTAQKTRAVYEKDDE